jgi:hypothetical protein
MVGIEFECLLATLLFAQAKETLDRRMAVGAILPLAGSAPLEFGGRRRLGQRIAGRDQRVNVYAIIHNVSHGRLLDAYRASSIAPERYCIAFVPINRRMSLFLTQGGHVGEREHRRRLAWASATSFVAAKIAARTALPSFIGAPNRPIDGFIAKVRRIASGLIEGRPTRAMPARSENHGDDLHRDDPTDL